MSKIYDPNLPPKLAKKLNAKEKSQKKENASEKTNEQKVSEIVLPQQETLTIVFDEKSQSLIGVNGKLRCNMLSGSMNAGEIWECQILPFNGARGVLPDAFATKKVGEVQVEKKPAAEIKKPAAKKNAPAAPKAKDDSDLRQKLKDANAQLKEANRKANRLQKQVDITIPKLKNDIKQGEEANRSLKTQVKKLEGQLKARSKGDVTAERDRLRQEVEEQKAEIERLKATLALFNNGTKPTSVTTYLTGESSIHCNLLDHDEYRVYFNPGKKTLRFIPSEKGTVRCEDKDVVIPVISMYSNFTKIRQLEARKEGSEVVVSLA